MFVVCLSIESNDLSSNIQWAGLRSQKFAKLRACMRELSGDGLKTMRDGYDKVRNVPNSISPPLAPELTSLLLLAIV